MHLFNHRPPPPPPETPPPVCLEVHTGDGDIENPVSLDEIHQKLKDVFPFQGVQITPRRGVNNQLYLSYFIDKSSITSPSGFDAIYMAATQMSPTEFLLGDVSLFGNLNSTICCELFPNVHGKCAVQVKNSVFTVRQFVVRYKGPDYTVGATMIKPSLQSAPSALVLSHFSSITTQFGIGLDITIANIKQFPLLKGTITHTNGYAGLCFSLNDMGTCNLSYYHKASKQAQVGIILEGKSKIELMAFGCKLNIHDWTVKGQIDWDWTVGAVLEKRILQLPVTLAVSGLMNYTKNQFRLGAGVIIG